MKGMKIGAGLMGLLLLASSCNMSNTTKGSLIGTGGGAALGSVIGGLIGKGKGAAIGAAVGGAVGAGTGIIIGRKMDKAKAEAEKIANAKVEAITDSNGQTSAVKVTLESGILFGTSSSTLSQTAKNTLNEFTANVLAPNPDMDIAIVGYTDNTGWKGSNAEQSAQKNLTLSKERASAVDTYLKLRGVTSSRIKEVMGMGQENPVADNSTTAGKQQNRRVEIYILPSETMINEAKQQSAQ